MAWPLGDIARDLRLGCPSPVGGSDALGELVSGVRLVEESEAIYRGDSTRIGIGI